MLAVWRLWVPFTSSPRLGRPRVFVRSEALARLAARQRFSFAKPREVMPLPDPVAVQRDSFKWFLEEGIAETLTDISPIEDFTGFLTLELPDPGFEHTKSSEEQRTDK